MSNIEVIENFFSSDELDVLENAIMDSEDNDASMQSGKNTRGLVLFEKGVDGGEVDLSRYLIHPTVDKEVYEIVERRIKEEFSVKEFTAYFHYLYPGSHMGWHSETVGITSAISIYLTRDWDWNYGGYICYEEEKEDFRLQIPDFNKAILQKSGTFHCVTPVYKDSPVRKSIQIFVQK